MKTEEARETVAALMREGWMRCFRSSFEDEMSPEEIEAIDPDEEILAVMRPVQGLDPGEQGLLMRAGVIDPEEIFRGAYGPPAGHSARVFGDRLSLAEIANRAAQRA